MRLKSRGPEETEEIGYKIGKMLKPGDIVGLYGELGTGKTAMVRGIAKAFGIDKRDITSASFTIIAEYAAKVPFFHVDLYRIENEDGLDSAGVWDCLRSDSVAVIEWAERLGAFAPKNMVSVRLEHGEGNEREIEVEGVDEEDWTDL